MRTICAFAYTVAFAIPAIWSLTAIAQNSNSVPRYNAAPADSIATSVVVPAGCATAYLSGVAPWNPSEKPPSPLGNTEAQTAGAIRNLEAELKKLGLSLGDIVMIRSYLAADPALGRMDYKGYSRAFKRFFGTTAQPHKPARATVQVANLVLPGMLVEMEAVAADCTSRSHN